MSFPVTIETDRLLLREMTEDDWRAIHAYMSLRETMRLSSYDPWTEHETREFVSRAVRRQKERVRLAYTVAVCLKDSGRLVGDFGLVIKEPGIAAVGMTVAPEHRGKGYATEAVRALIDFGFRDLGLSVIWARTDFRNRAAMRALEKAGMLSDRFSSEYLKVDIPGAVRIDVMERSAGYALLREDWIACSAGDVAHRRAEGESE